MAFFPAALRQPTWSPLRWILPMPAVAPPVAKALAGRKPAQTAQRPTAARPANAKAPTGRKHRLKSDALFDRLPIR